MHWANGRQRARCGLGGAFGPTGARLAAVGLAALIAHGLGGCGEEFTSGAAGAGGVGAGGVGAGGSSSGATSPGGGSGGATVPTTSSTATAPGGNGGGTTSTSVGGGMAGAAPGGGGGALPTCSHGVCDVGQPLPAGCGECQATICQDNGHPSCCTLFWGLRCIRWVNELCTEECGDPCARAFSSLAGYQACVPIDLSTCKFITTESGSCNQICASAGATCTGAASNPDSCQAVSTQEDCDYGTGTSRLCTCAPG